MTPVRIIHGSIPTLGLDLNQRLDLLKAEFHRVLPKGWRIKKSDYNQGLARVRYTIEIEPKGAPA